MRIFKYKTFDKWTKKEKISNSALIDAIKEVENGLYDADLGSQLFKKRVAKQGKGKRGSYRTILAFKKDSKAIFIYGYAKNVLSNISEHDLRDLKILSKYYIELTNEELTKMLSKKVLIEVIDYEKNQKK